MSGEFERDFAEEKESAWDQDPHDVTRGEPGSDETSWEEEPGPWDGAAEAPLDPAEEGGPSEVELGPGDIEDPAEWEAPTRRIPAGPLPGRRLGWDGAPKGRKLIKPDEVRLPFSPQERLLILDTWERTIAW